jgi:uncharacterized protein YndB with AHSA1/START domain
LKTALRILLSLVTVLVLVGGGIYLDGTMLPVDHTTSITGTIAAPPAKVFALITDVGLAPTWRPAVKAVTVLPLVNGRDHWIEDLGHGETMTFLATETKAPTSREVLLYDPEATFGGTWLYELSPGPTPNTTTLKITETGFIKPPLYRFMMRHVFGMTRNLDQYMADLRAAATKL